MSRSTITLTALAACLLAACAEHADLTVPEPEDAQLVISRGPQSADWLAPNPHFSFLGRLVSVPEFTGTFDPAADPKGTPKRLVAVEALEGEPLTVLDQVLRLD